MVEVYVVCKTPNCKTEIDLGKKMIKAHQTKEEAWPDYKTQTIRCQTCGSTFQYPAENLLYRSLES